MSNNTGTTHYYSLQRSYWLAQRTIIMILTSLIGPQSGPIKGLCIFDKILILSLVKEIVLYTVPS